MLLWEVEKDTPEGVRYHLSTGGIYQQNYFVLLIVFFPLKKQKNSLHFSVEKSSGVNFLRRFCEFFFFNHSKQSLRVIDILINDFRKVLLSGCG